MGKGQNSKEEVSRSFRSEEKETQGWSEGPKTPLRVRAGAAGGTSLLHTPPLLRGPRSPGCPGGLVLPHRVLRGQAHSGPTPQQQRPLPRHALSIWGSLHPLSMWKSHLRPHCCSTVWLASLHPPLLPCLLSPLPAPMERVPQRQPDGPQCTGLRAQFPRRPNSLHFKIPSQEQSTWSNDKTA